MPFVSLMFSTRLRDVLYTGAFVALALALGLIVAQVQWAGYVLAVMLGVPALAVFVYYIAENPLMGITLALISGPFIALQREWVPLPVDGTQALLGIVGVAYVLRWVINRADGAPMERRPWVYDKRMVILFAAFMLFCGSSYFKSIIINDWFKEMLKWFEMMLLYVLVANERNPRIRALLLGAVFVVVGVQGLLGLFQFFFKGGAPDHFAILGKRFYRAFGTLQQPNPFGGLMGMTWPIAFSCAMVLLIDYRQGLSLFKIDELRGAITQVRGRRMLGAGALATSAIAIAGLVASWSRGGWLAGLCAASAFALMMAPRPLPALGMAATAFALVYSTDLISIMPGALRSRLFGFYDDYALNGIDVSAAEITTNNFATLERLAHWQAAINMIGGHMWFGVGLGNYEYAYDRYALPAWRAALGHAHNYYLNIFAEAGLFAFLTYLAFWGYILIRAARLGRMGGPRGWLATGIFASLIHLHMHNMVDNLFVSNMWLFMGVFLGLLEHTHPSTEKAAT